MGASITRINAELCEKTLEDHLRFYDDVRNDLICQLETSGVVVAAKGHVITESMAEDFSKKGIEVANDRRSIHRGWISPACVRCRTGVGSLTCYISLACNRQCFFCFNPNQKDYAIYKDSKHDLIADIRGRKRSGFDYKDIALSGGEPLLFESEVVDFFAECRLQYPEAYTRLYTNGDLLDRRSICRLAECGLREIRISLKREAGRPDDTYETTLNTLRMAVERFEAVVVEMPVLPDDLEGMKGVLCDLDEIGISGINLLELCFPMHNWGEFKRRGYEIKRNIFRVPYSYEYAGGIPIAGSEEVCLALVEYSQDMHLKLGVHYCSLENKFSSQVYLNNEPYRKYLSEYCFSERDYFYKSIRAFDSDARLILKHLAQEDRAFVRASGPSGIQFHPELALRLSDSCGECKVAVCSHIVERRSDDFVLREVDASAATINALGAML